MTRLLMLDSGAFSVWTRGHTVNLEEYIAFCLQFPEVSYYVSLDVIPGEYTNKKSLRSVDGVNEGCRQGWRNYRRMIQELPMEKVIPVFHQNDDPRWLEKYLNFGVPYIGISPANDNGTTQKLQWMRGLKKYLFDGAGRPNVRTHGFAVTSHSMMKFWDWHSVDSATWQRAASFGEVFIPRRTGGELDYSKTPARVGVTHRCQLIQKTQLHIGNMTPLVKQHMLEYLETCNAPLGRYKIIQKQEGYKLKEGESWDSKKHHTIQRTIEEGITTSRDCRALLNARFIKRANKVLPVEHIYLAGTIFKANVECRLRKRLLSHSLLSGPDKLTEYFRQIQGNNDGN